MMLSPGRRSFLGRTRRRLMERASAGCGRSSCSSSASHFDGRFDGPGEEGCSVVMARPYDIRERAARERETERWMLESKQLEARWMLPSRGHVSQPCCQAPSPEPRPKNEPMRWSGEYLHSSASHLLGLVLILTHTLYRCTQPHSIASHVYISLNPSSSLPIPALPAGL